jgi:hypothetical protein
MQGLLLWPTPYTYITLHYISFLSTILELYSEIALSRKPFGIRHMHIYTFLLRMTDTMPSQNIDLSSWDTLYIRQILTEQYGADNENKCLYYRLYSISAAEGLVTRLNSILYRLQLKYSVIRGWVRSVLSMMCCRYKGLVCNHKGVVSIKWRNCCDRLRILTH